MNRKYILVIICCCLYIGACNGTANAFGTFIIPMSQQTGALRGTVSLGSTIYGISSGLFAPLMLWSIRKYPLRNVMITVAALSALLTCSFTFMTNVYLYLAVNVFKGLLNAFFGSAIIIMIIGNWFNDAKSTVSALVLGFSGVAGAIFSPLFTHITNTYGLKFGFFTMVFFQFILAVPSYLYLTLTPQEQNFKPFTSSRNKAVNKKEDTETYRHTFKVNDPMFYALCIVSILTAMLMHINPHFNGYAQSLDKAALGPLMMSSIMIGNIFFKFVAGIVCDKFGAPYGVPFVCITGILACIILYTATSDFMLMAGAFIMGTVYGNQVTTPALIRHVYGNKQYPDVYAGQSVPYGLMYFGSMMYGYVYDFTGSYKLCFLIGIGFLIIAMLLNYYILHKYEKEKNSAL